MLDKEPDESEVYHDGNEKDIKQKQGEAVSDSEAFQDPEIDRDAVQVLPGTGGPDDVGYIEVEPEDYNRDGK